MRHAGTNAAQLELGGEADSSGFAAPADPAALRAAIAKRVAAHRARRATGADDTPAVAAASRRAPQGRRAQIAGAIAERYAQAESYRSFLAAEAERSVRHAEAAAEVATINARAIATAQQQLMADLDRWDLPADPRDARTSAAVQTSLVDAAMYAEPQDETAPCSPLPPPAARRYTVRLPDEFVQPPLYSNGSVIRPHSEVPDEIDLAEACALDEEIAFRHAPAGEQQPLEALPLTANLIEFPRQLVAARKARPRLAEGPLREEAFSSEEQLRIFEVEPAPLPPAAVIPATSPVPEWGSILLAAQPVAEYAAPAGPAFASTVVPQVAALSRRLMAGVMDASIVLATLAAAAGVFVQTAVRVHPAHAALAIKPAAAAIALACAAVALGILYQVLFFTFSGGTPGMRYARIALCTFADEVPSRAAMRRRLLHLLCGALPLGLGLFWAFLDEDNLAWHDRLSHMYQRSY